MIGSAIEFSHHDLLCCKLQKQTRAPQAVPAPTVPETEMESEVMRRINSVVFVIGVLVVFTAGDVAWLCAFEGTYTDSFLHRHLAGLLAAAITWALGFAALLIARKSN